jgi:hypothetical protein
MAELVRQMAGGEHCQAACDLLLLALNDPKLDGDRAAALEQDAPLLASTLWGTLGVIETKAISAMALGGGLAEGQQFNDPGAVFDILAEAGRSSHVVETCRAAWKLSRNPMAMLLPVVWAQLAACDRRSVSDDALPPVEMVHGVPGYALDQFTRRGNSVSRDLLGADQHLRELLQAAAVPSSQLVRTVGDLIFLLEGGRVRRRLRWATDNELRLPHRWLPAAGQLGPYLDQALRLVEAKARQIANLRREHLSTFAT